MKDKIIIGILIIVLIFLVLNMAGAIWYNIDYEQRKDVVMNIGYKSKTEFYKRNIE